MSTSSAKTKPKVHLVWLFWLQLFLSPLFLSPLSHRVSPAELTAPSFLMFALAPAFYSIVFMWRTRPSAARLPWTSQSLCESPMVYRAGVFGAFFGALGVLPIALSGAWDVIHNHDPTLPVTRWMVVMEPMMLSFFVLFFAAFYCVIGMVAGCLLAGIQYVMQWFSEWKHRGHRVRQA